MSRAPESFWGARREELSDVLPVVELVCGRMVSRWWAIRDLSARMRKTENSSRTAIWVTRVAAMACGKWSVGVG